MKKSVFVAKSTVHGRGVFSSRKIKKGEVFLTEPVLVVDCKEDNCDQIKKYYYPWHANKYYSICMGAGSFFNHSDEPNVKIHSIDQDEKTMSFSALEDIEEGSELFIKYK